MTDRKPGRVIYIGSIPYDQTEEQISDIASSVGPIARLKLIFDKDTGKSKGYAFVEYHDSETAASAVRNLNNYQIGNRTLKVDFSFETSIGPNILTSTAGNNNVIHNNTVHNNKSQIQNQIQNLNLGTNQTIPLLPPGKTLPRNATPAVEITATLDSLPKTRIANIILSSHRMAKSNPLLTEQLLTQCPQLSYSIVQSLLMLNLVDERSIGDILNTNFKQNISHEQEQPPPPPMASAPVPVHVPAPAPVSAPAPARSSAPVIDEGQAALLRQVLELTDTQISSLPQDQQNTIRELKNKIQRGEIVI